MRADALQSVISNYSVLQELWEEAQTIVRDTEVIGRLKGVATIRNLNFSLESYWGSSFSNILIT